MRKKLVCITGADGSGKSTLIDALLQRYPGSVHAHIWKLLGQTRGLPFRSKEDIDAFLCELTPDSRLLFLAHALKYAIDSALASDAGLVLINGYYYKYFASELVLGASPQLAGDLARSFPVPDLTFYLEFPLEASAARKPAFSRYECGLAAEGNSADFLAFQEKCQLEWERYVQEDWIQIDGRLGVEEKLAAIIKHLEG